uniref:Uncharacterized protein n=1 Tax=Apteryx owenii TaxID=8824 RepID=A0A8B9QL89_APTOW
MSVFILKFNIAHSIHHYAYLHHLSFSLGISNTHLNLESINSSGFSSHSTSFLLTTIVCTMNLCLLFSFGS